MDVQNNPPPASVPAPANASLVRGGLFFRAQQALGLIRPNQWNLGRRIAALIAIVWLPMLLITAVVNHGALRSFFTDYRVYTRVLVAIPALLMGEVLTDQRFRMVLGYISSADLLEAPDKSYMDGVLANMGRLRDSFLPELIILVLIYVRILMRYQTLLDTTPWIGHLDGAGFHFTAAGWYGALVSVPLWTFLLTLALWRWLLWSYFAFKLSTRKLKLVASHPDKRGGLGFLSLMISAFAPIAFAVNSAIASNLRRNILHHGLNLISYKLYAIVLIAVLFLLALGPLLAFVPRLAALRINGIVIYGILGQLQSTGFDDKWILHRAGREAEFLVAPEINTMSGFSNLYEKIEGLRPFPADLVSLYGLIAAIILPAILVLMTEIPLATILKNLLGALS
jgi:hypothetical protein